MMNYLSIEHSLVLRIWHTEVRQYCINPRHACSAGLLLP